MTQPRQHLRHRCHDMPGRQGWSIDHNDRNSQGAGGQNFGLRPRAACVFGDDVGDAVIAQQGGVMGHIKGTARDDRGGLRQDKRGRWINKAQQVMVLGLGGKGLKVLLADSEEHVCRGIGQGGHGGGDIGDLGPDITRRRVPRRAFQGEELHTASKAGIDRMTAHLCCKGVGGVDDMGDIVGLHIATKPRHTAKATDARGQRLGYRVGRAPGIGKHGVDARGGKGGGKAACLGRSPQQEKAHG